MRHLYAIAVGTPVIVIAVVVALAGWAGARPVSAQDEDTITIALNEYQDSGISGTATLATVDEGTQVSMELTGDALSGDHPTHIHTGTCDDFDPDPTFPLTTVILDEVSDEGTSDTTVGAVALDALLADDYVILVHKSPEELTTYFVCGDIKPSNAVAAAAGEAPATATGEPASADHATGAGGMTHMPQTGVGTTAGGGGSFPPIGLVLLSAVWAVLLGAVLLRRRSTR